MPESPVEKDRDRRQGFTAIARHQISADVELTNVELLVARHAPMAFARAVTRQHHELETVCFYRALFQSANDFVIAHRDR